VPKSNKRMSAAFEREAAALGPVRAGRDRRENLHLGQMPLRQQELLKCSGVGERLPLGSPERRAAENPACLSSAYLTSNVGFPFPQYLRVSHLRITALCG